MFANRSSCRAPYLARRAAAAVVILAGTLLAGCAQRPSPSGAAAEAGAAAEQSTAKSSTAESSAPAAPVAGEAAAESSDTDVPADTASEKTATHAAPAQGADAALFKYPAAERGKVVDEYHGQSVADPYRWLEDPDSPATRAWIEAENHLTFDFLKTSPARDSIRERITHLWDYEKFGIPTVRGKYVFYGRNDGVQNQSVIYVTGGLDGEPRVLLDPNKLSDDGTVALSGTAISDDGELFAYGLSSAGSDWQEWRVRQVDTGRDLDDLVKWIKFSGASWASDNSGFYYSRFDEPDEQALLTGVNYYQKLFYHKIGTPQSADRLVYERPDEKEWGFSGHVTEDGRWLVISVSHGTERKNQLFYLDLSVAGSEVVEWISGFDAQYDFLGNEGTTFYLRTDLDAPRHRIIAADITKPDRKDWKEIVPEQPHVLQGATIVSGEFLAQYLEDAHSVVRRYKLDGTPLGEIALDGVGTVNLGAARQEDKEVFYSFTSFLAPPTIYRYDVVQGASTVFRQPKVDFDPSNYETEQVFYTSKDGTRVPMFITHRKDLTLDGRNPTLLYGYGGFDISLSPTFSPARCVWLELGGIYAQPSLRGGGEYGREWHEAGMKQQKQNVFDDFIAAAEYLIDKRYTSPARLAATGRSNGGLLVGAALTQRPELFGAMLPGVGVMDMLRFHQFTIGWAWVSEYGSSENAADFPTLLAYSPLHNIKPGTAYPATMIITGDHDDRVVPAHSFKFAAELQAAQAGPKPILIRIETSAGHGAGMPTSKQIEEAADSYAFLIKELGIDVPAPKK